MEWTWLVALICPIMMLFMMKGMHGKHQEHHKPDNHAEESLQQQVNDLNQKVSEPQKANQS
ncbi:DUF2933 domain-containing protein [Cohnella algarum]|uniref:DUF2933 domain-containing protein n=1 Tax=Cohnella algarum TaxID=2044859 RepID=UPI0019688E1B|nr:DUF2933 domain-containing protein [Cohnella algarum]MBN2981791.1 DUF2933 domain-containing protein [Cohnella algarum]